LGLGLPGRLGQGVDQLAELLVAWLVRVIASHQPQHASIGIHRTNVHFDALQERLVGGRQVDG
jgi:hypothetical protein